MGMVPRRSHAPSRVIPAEQSGLLAAVCRLTLKTSEDGDGTGRACSSSIYHIRVALHLSRACPPSEGMLEEEGGHHS